jgi:N-acetylglucosaminyl-diphospho-decaprenol L-rhamnosyltransferase
VAVDLSILIVSYNTRQVTLDCLASLYAHPPMVSFEVILLDNASPDGSAEAIGAAFPQVNLVASAENTGFAGGNNIAAEQASGRRLLLLNPDTIVLPGSLQALWDFAERHPARGIWGGRTLFEDGSLNPTSCWGRITPWSLFCSASGLTYVFPRSPLFNPEGYGAWARDSEREVDIVTGCFLLIDRALWQRLGGFDRTFFMYAEEADLCLRAAKLGHRPAITPDAEIIHLGGRSEASPVEKVIKTTRGRVTLIRKHWPAWQRAVGLTLFRAWAFSRALGSRVARDRRGGGADKWRTIWRRRAEWLSGY